MSASALDIRSLLHRCTLDTAVISFGRGTRTAWMRALLDSFGTHRILPFRSSPELGTSYRPLTRLPLALGREENLSLLPRARRYQSRVARHVAQASFPRNSPARGSLANSPMSSFAPGIEFLQFPSSVVRPGEDPWDWSEIRSSYFWTRRN